MNKLIIGGKEIEVSDESWKNMEKQFKKKSFYPEMGEEFYLIVRGNNSSVIRPEDYINEYKVDFDCGLAFKTHPETEAKLAEMEAVTKIRKFIFEEGLSFEPDWLDHSQKKWDIHYDIAEEEFKSSCLCSFCQKPSPFGHLKSEEDCEKVIKNCSEELKIIFNINK